jgi:hypothetical protein
MFINLKRLYARIKLNNFVIKKVYPIEKSAFIIMKRRLITYKINTILFKPLLKIEKHAFK